MTDETQGEIPSEDATAPEAEPEAPETAEAQEAEDQDDTTAEGQDDGDGDTEPPKPKKSKGGFQKRIDDLTRRQRELERDRDAWREAYMRGEKPGKDDAGEPQRAPKPRLADFDDDEAYQEAFVDWKLEQREAERKLRDREQELQRAKQQPVQEAVKAIREADEDAFSALQDLPALSETTLVAIADADDPAKVAHWLGENPDEAQRLFGLSPSKTGREIAKIEARLSQTQQKPKTTNAPPPPKQVKGSGSVQKDPTKMSYEEYKAWRNGEARAKKG